MSDFVLLDHILYLRPARALPGAFHDQLIRDQGDELAVGGLIVFRIDVVAEDLIYVFDLAPRPGHLDGMADGALHLGSGGLEALGNAWI